ncbi:MAG TPA: hypothetical protein PLP17_01945 [Oligoflexia bacterium]|nr:hypothetical protein [Oligoflexia bacterium]
MTRIQRTAAMIAMVLLPCTTLAQDHNYWNNQFGSRSALMGGAVVGGVRDTSAVFYNPGALGFIDNQSLSVSANALRVERSVIENGAGDGRDLDSDTLSVVPLLISGITFLNDSQRCARLWHPHQEQLSTRDFRKARCGRKHS